MRPGHRSSPSRGRPPTAIECALAVVTAGLAVAMAMLAVVGSARASPTAAPSQGNPYIQGPSAALAQVWAPQDAQPSGKAVPSATPTAAPSAVSSPTPTDLTPFMAMPVEGVWQVICGYRCGLHDEEHISTYAVDIVLADGGSAGLEVSSPAEGRIIAVEDSSTYICRGEVIEGTEAGAVVIMDFRDPSGVTLRLRLVHIDPASVPDELRPDGGPVPVNAGAVLGAVAEMDRCSHLHVSLTRLEGGREVPVPLTIEGALLEDCDSENCWKDALIPSTDR